jgi:hypothetical protein
MSLTYNQIINKFEVIASNNPFIKRFGSGEITEIETEGPTSGDYPFLWIVPQQVEVGENDLVYVIRVLVFDIDDTDDSKQQQILSDTLRTLIDVIRVFRNSDPDYGVNDRPICLPFTHRFVDYNTGWYTDLRLITDMNNSPCDDY